MPVEHAPIGQEILHSQQHLQGSPRRQSQRFDPPGAEARVIGRLIDADEARQPVAGPGIMPVAGKFKLDGAHFPKRFGVELPGFHQRVGEAFRRCREWMRRYCRFPGNGDGARLVLNGR